MNDESKALFWSKVRRTRGCWIWTGPKSKQGYGVFNFTLREGVQVSMLAHRFAWESERGRIPKGHQIDHLCHNRDKKCSEGRQCKHRLCVRPEHCEPVTRSVNLSRGRNFWKDKTHCPQGHRYTAENTLLEKRKNGKVARHCRKCMAAAGRRRKERENG